MITRTNSRMIDNVPVNVKDFGAIGDGITDDTSAINSMISDVGYVIFPSGTYKLTTTTIDTPITFEQDSRIVVASGETVSIRNIITSSKQFIFTGDGDYDIGHDSDSGEDARQIHASWFGAFPSSEDNGDQGVAINKAFASMGNTRESIIDFDIGNYFIETPIEVTRGGWVRGSGTRRTVFRINSTSVDVFTTLGVACKFTDIQFELHNGTLNDGYDIVINHGECEIYNVDTGWTEHSIKVDANNCRISNIRGTYGVDHGIGSSLIEVVSGTGARITGIQLGTSDNGVESVVLIGGANQTGPISTFKVYDMESIIPSRLVTINAINDNISRGSIDGLQYAGFAGTNPDCIIKIENNSASNISSLILNNSIINSYASNGIILESTGSGGIYDVSLSNIIVNGSTGTGVSFIRTSGSIYNIKVSSTTNLEARSTPILYSGSSIDNVIVEAGVLPETRPAISYDLELADDTVEQIDLNRSIFTSFLSVTAGSDEYALLVARLATLPSHTTINVSTNVDIVNTPLTGTTGVDGKITIGITDGVIYVENRSSSSQRISVNLMTGI